MGKQKAATFHPKNVHRSRYNLAELIKVYPQLKSFVFVNKYDVETVDFSNPNAVKALNTALLFKFYNIKFWDFPDTNLCPPIPGRVDYIHYLADLLKESNLTKNTSILDIGTGASCIYPILGNSVYQWQFVASDSSKKSLNTARVILKENNIDKEIVLRFQPNTNHIFKGILTAEDKFAATMCNPPFYKSEEEAFLATSKKLKGLGIISNKERNFGGTHQELCYKGGEKAFVHTYLYESSLFKNQCFWFTTLVSKKENLKSMYASLKKLKATEIKTIQMSQGNKITRIVAWTFLSKAAQKEW